ALVTQCLGAWPGEVDDQHVLGKHGSFVDGLAVGRRHELGVGRGFGERDICGAETVRTVAVVDDRLDHQTGISVRCQMASPLTTSMRLSTHQAVCAQKRNCFHSRSVTSYL